MKLSKKLLAGVAAGFFILSVFTGCGGSSGSPASSSDSSQEQGSTQVSDTPYTSDNDTDTDNTETETETESDKNTETESGSETETETEQEQEEETDSDDEFAIYDGVDMTKLAKYRQSILDLTNTQRAENGIDTLAMADEKAQAAAQVRANEIIEKWSHERPDGTYCNTLLNEYGVYWTTCGENLAAGAKTPEIAVEAWMESEGHRKNILNGKFTKLAVGYVEYTTDKGTDYYWVQIFIG